MSAFVFRNKGLIDPRSISTFGVSSKDNPTGSIGFFGTGLKYAIAILLRLDCTITIYSGKIAYNFTTKRDKIRNDEFDFVLMNGEPMGFTTELGKNWKPWQVFRELWSNMTDERGSMEEVNHPLMVDPADDETVIVITGEPFHDVWSSRSDIILTTPAAFKGESCHVHLGPSKYLFYRGIRVYELTEQSTVTYNIQARMDLTEDRTLASVYYANRAVAKALVEMDSPELIRKTMTAPKGSFEHDNISVTGFSPSETWLELTTDMVSKFEPSLNNSCREAVVCWGRSRLESLAPAKLTEIDKARLDKAVNFCLSLGYPVTDFPITVTAFLGEGILGRAEDGQIMISLRTFEMGTKMLAGTILEEYFHLKFRHADYTAGFQNYLMDQLITMGERVNGEML